MGPLLKLLCSYCRGPAAATFKPSALELRSSDNVRAQLHALCFVHWENYVQGLVRAVETPRHLDPMTHGLHKDTTACHLSGSSSCKLWQTNDEHTLLCARLQVPQAADAHVLVGSRKRKEAQDAHTRARRRATKQQGTQRNSEQAGHEPQQEKQTRQRRATAKQAQSKQTRRTSEHTGRGTQRATQRTNSTREEDTQEAK